MTYRDWLTDDVRRLWREEGLGASHGVAGLGARKSRARVS